ncbi:phospholipase D-like domain-containing protein [Iamia majanohamensis]|uniref:Phospholipase D-like domain-containing protein n=1 Tax=Iamia majanohamensis TaxID=467976 RepID=A0AAF0BWR7_9ACTN|nr:phospholipase D-like domain-containing protein [Iamia majanohamensis]WCO68095.1 phospholipase D-like domain-containing protein [Iamia majanohamensis]
MSHAQQHNEQEVVEGGWDPRRVFEVVLGVPATDGNRLQVLRNGDRIFPAMLEAIEGAQRSVDFLTFIYWTGDIAQTFARALADRAEAGVRVRVLLDALGSRRMDDGLIELMVDAGCEVQRFRPVDSDAELGETFHRTHRKVLVCDGTVGFTGGVGIAAEWEGDAQGPDDWRDTHYRVEGPGVDGLRAAFLQNWAETGLSLLDPGIDHLEPQGTPGSTPLQVIADGDATGPSSTGLAFHLMLAGAERRVRIATAYFTPDDDMLQHIVEASERGVEVEILVPGEHCDKSFVRWAAESDYRRLLDAGVSVCVFEPSMLHAKVMTADGRVAVIGSSNINSRSLSEDDEVIMITFDEEVVAQLDDDFDGDLGRAQALDPEDWARRGIVRRAAESVASTVSDLL